MKDDPCVTIRKGKIRIRLRSFGAEFEILREHRSKSGGSEWFITQTEEANEHTKGTYLEGNVFQCVLLNNADYLF